MDRSTTRRGRSLRVRRWSQAGLAPRGWGFPSSVRRPVSGRSRARPASNVQLTTCLANGTDDFAPEVVPIQRVLSLEQQRIDHDGGAESSSSAGSRAQTGDIPSAFEGESSRSGLLKGCESHSASRTSGSVLAPVRSPHCVGTQSQPRRFAQAAPGAPALRAENAREFRLHARFLASTAHQRGIA